MKILFLIAFITISYSLSAQQEKVDIPKGVVYKYADSATNEKAKALIREELSASPSYSLNTGILFIGPVLWARYGKITDLANIKGGDMTILGYKKETSSGKMTQNNDDFKLVWDQLRKEITAADFTLRKATAAELKYYWSVISFDIDEPLIIIETKEHNYILDLSAKDMKLVWLDEAPRE
jgi:hypothetical protein